MSVDTEILKVWSELYGSPQFGHPCYFGPFFTTLGNDPADRAESASGTTGTYQYQFRRVSKNARGFPAPIGVDLRP